MNKLKVVGVAHSSTHKDYPKVLDYINNCIESNQKVSIESPVDLTTILKTSLKDFVFSEEAVFLKNVAKTLIKKCVEIETVEDDELWDKINTLDELQEENEETIVLSKEASVLRSLTIYDQAVSNKSNVLITGCMHAYDIEMLKKDAIIKYITKPEFEEMIKRDKYLKKYLSGKITRNKLLSKLDELIDF